MKKILLIAFLCASFALIVNAEPTIKENYNITQTEESSIQETTGYYVEGGSVKVMGVRVELIDSWSGTKLQLHSLSLTGRWVKQSGTIYSCSNEKGPGGNYYRYKVKVALNSGVKWVYFNL